MNKVLHIIRWELLNKVRNKYFIFVTLFTPLLLYILLATNNTQNNYNKRPEVIAIVTNNTQYVRDMSALVNKDSKNSINEKLLLINGGKPTNTAKMADLDNDLHKNLVSAIIYIIESNDSTSYKIVANNHCPPSVINRIETFIEKLNISAKNKIPIKEIESPIITKQSLDTDKSKSGSVLQNKLLNNFILAILYIVIVIYSANQLIRGFNEEKSSRLIEVLLTLATPQQLILGKVLGLILTGVIQAILFKGILSLMTEYSNTNFSISISNEILLLLVLGYLFNIIFFTWLGIKSKSDFHSNSILSFFTIVLTLPIILYSWLISNTHSIFFSLLKFFPVTSVQVTLFEATGNNSPEIYYSVIPMITFILLVWLLTTRSLKNIIDGGK